MIRFIGLMAVLLCITVIIVIIGCQSDIILPKDVPLKGTYVGVYSYITNFGAGTLEEVTSAHITFVFDETSYHLNLDTSYTDQHCFCATDGEYALTEGVRLKEAHSQPDEDAGCTSCNSEENPEGVFVREVKGDSLILKLQEGTTLYELRLLKVSD